MSYFDKILWQDGRHLATPLSLQDPTTVALLQAPLIDADWLAKAVVRGVLPHGMTLEPVRIPHPLLFFPDSGV